MFLWWLVGVILFHSSNRTVLKSTTSLLLSLSPFVDHHLENNNNNNNTMTVVTLEQQEPDHVVNDNEHEHELLEDQEPIPTALAHPRMPSWVPELRSDWGETVVVDEWKQDDGTYRAKHGWKVRPLFIMECCCVVYCVVYRLCLYVLLLTL
jgi:hypothetical protein